MKSRNDFPFYDYDPGDKQRLKRVMAEFQKGFNFLKRFENERTVSIFGSHLDKEGEREYEQARRLGGLLAKEKIVVLTGGGPGAMEAANRGAFEAGGQSVGINLELGRQEQRNSYVKESICLHYLFVRRVMLAHASQAYVFFPGGFGTLDEFFEIATLVVTEKIYRQIPIVLMGRDYWNSLKKWLKRMPMEKHRAILKSEFFFWRVVDNEKQALAILKKIPSCFVRHESV
ncbi:MAG: TIGR00730 family Rossman fold protein [Candidatus Nealsonbacteria bacterium]|nr:TIGR00730 family Rossman fold protein [Candidatus Nealsonbacteria bacterium]